MERKIIKIDEDKCNGCGLCAQACHEGPSAWWTARQSCSAKTTATAWGIACPPARPGRSPLKCARAPAYDQAAVEAAKQAKAGNLPCGCPGEPGEAHRAQGPARAGTHRGKRRANCSNWPVQIKLAPVNAPYFHGASLLIAADCTAYACGDFHRRFMRGPRDPDWLPEAGRGGLRGKAHGDPAAKRHPERDGCAHGGPLLRRD